MFHVKQFNFKKLFHVKLFLFKLLSIYYKCAKIKKSNAKDGFLWEKLLRLLIKKVV